MAMDLHVPLLVAIPADEAQWLSVVTAKRKRARKPSPGSKTGRGTKRAGKPPAAKLLRLLKPVGNRAELVRFIGREGKTGVAVLTRFNISDANLRSYLGNLNRVHGIGFRKENDFLTLQLPPGVNWRGLGL